MKTGLAPQIVHLPSISRNTWRWLSAQKFSPTPASPTPKISSAAGQERPEVEVTSSRVWKV